MPVCPSAQQLWQFLENTLPSEEHAEVAAHLAACGACGSILERLAAAPPPPNLDDYEIEEVAAVGGMSIIYRGQRQSDGTSVAIKVFYPSTWREAEPRARFLQEADVLASLNHPAIVKIFKVGDRPPHLILEWIEGSTLRSKLAGRPVNGRDAAAFLAKAADALAVVHRRDPVIVHRDLNPNNIMVRGEVAGALAERPPCVIDFGISKVLGSSDGLTGTSDVLGTEFYLAPEQIPGSAWAISPATDVYALGVTLYEMLTGRPPFVSNFPADLFYEIRYKDPIPPRRMIGRIPRELEAICLKCLEKHPLSRYPDAGELAVDLRRFLAGERTVARPAGVARRAWKWCRRRPAIAILMAIAAVLSLIAIALALWVRESDRELRTRAYHEQRSALENALQIGDYDRARNTIETIRQTWPDDRFAAFAVGYLQILQAETDADYDAALASLTRSELHQTPWRRENAEVFCKHIIQFHKFLRRLTGSIPPEHAIRWDQLPELFTVLETVITKELESDLVNAPVADRLLKAAKALARMAPSQVALRRDASLQNRRTAVDHAQAAVSLSKEAEVVCEFAHYTIYYAETVVNVAEIEALRLLLTTVADACEQARQQGSLTPRSFIQMRVQVLGLFADLASLRLHPQYTRMTQERFERNLIAVADALARWPADERDVGMSAVFELLTAPPTPGQLGAWNLPASKPEYEKRNAYLYSRCGELLVAWENVCKNPKYQRDIESFKSKLKNPELILETEKPSN